MLNNLTVSAHAMGLPELRNFDNKKVERSSKDDRSDSFEKHLSSKPEGAIKKPEVKTKEKEKEEQTDQDIKSEAPPKPMSKQKVAATGRAKAIQDFMDSFESEFGIPATRIVAAMAKLEPSQLNEKPEVTADAVIEELDLPEDQKERAAEMYAQLLGQLSQSDAMVKPNLPAENSTSSAKLLGSMALTERILAANNRRDTVNKSVDMLNQKFWLRPEVKTPTLEVDQLQSSAMEIDEPALESSTISQPTTVEPTSMDDVMERLNNAVEDLATPVPESKADISTEVKATGYERPAIDIAKLKSEFAKLAQQKQMAEGSSDVARFAVPVSEMDPRMLQPKKLNLPDFDPNHSMMVQQSASAKAQLQSMADQFNQGRGQGNGQDSSQKSGADLISAHQSDISKASKETDAARADFAQMLGLQKVDLSQAKNLAPAALAVPVTPTPQDNEVNIQQVMNQAQYLIKKGGGEVNVKMTPEGLGQIQLKVQVENGKVSIQMGTDTPEAKKAIESGLSELKAGLAAQKFSVDHVKVDVVSQANTDNNSQSNMNFNSNAQRDQSLKQYWNQFQENFGNKSQRDSFFDMTNIKGYPTQRKTEPLEPVVIGQTSKAKSADSKKGNGLNLVA